MPLDYATPPDATQRPYGWSQRVAWFLAAYFCHAGFASAAYCFRRVPPMPVAAVVFPLAFVPPWQDEIGDAWEQLSNRFTVVTPFALNSLPVGLFAALTAEAYHRHRRRPKV